MATTTNTTPFGNVSFYSPDQTPVTKQAPVAAQNQAQLRMSVGTKYIPMLLLIDTSGSTRAGVSGTGKSIHTLCKESLAQFLDDPTLREQLQRRLLVSIYSFGNGGVKRLISNTLLKDINTAEMLDRIPEPDGLTPMGKAINLALEDCKSFREEKIMSGYTVYHPIMAIMTDDRPTDEEEMVLATKSVDALLSAKPRKHLQLLPVGIGSHADFAHLTRLLKNDPNGEMRVLQAGDDFVSYVQLLKNTTIAVAHDQHGGAGLMGNGGVFMGA